MALFGLTAVDVNAPGGAPPIAGAAGSGVGTPQPPIPTPAADVSQQSTSSGGQATSPLPDLLQLSPHATYLTELPNPADVAAAAVAHNAGRLSGRGSRGHLPATGTPPYMPVPGSAPAGIQRSLSNLGSAFSASSPRLPPIAGPTGGGGAGLLAPGLPASPEREYLPQQGVTGAFGSRPVTPREMAAAAAANSDQRCFDGRELGELVKVSVEDYRDVARVQRMLTVALGQATAEAAKAEALLQIREASVQNPMFVLTPALVDLVKEQLHSRNRILRPAAAYALAGYAANSRYGRGLVTVSAGDLLPRLNAMLRCKVDSMDARYAALAILNISMHSEHKDSVGRSGTIPLLIALVRQNVGKNPTNMPPSNDKAIGALIGALPSDSLSRTTSMDSGEPDTADAQPSATSIYRSSQHTSLYGVVPFSPRESHLAGQVSTGATGATGAHKGHLLSSVISACVPASPLGPFVSGGVASSTLHPITPFNSAHVPTNTLLPYNSHPPHQSSVSFLQPHQSATASGTTSRSYAWGGSDGTIGGPAAVWGDGGGGGSSGSSLGFMPRPFASEGGQKAGNVLEVKAAAAHAAAALVNLAEIPVNRQRMRDAGITSLIEDVLASRNDNSIKERFRLLVEFMHMDTHRFQQAQAAADVTAIAAVSHAVVNFVQRGREAKAAAAANAAAAAAAGNARRSRAGSGSGAGTQSGASLSILGGTTLKGSLTWVLAQQLERGDEDGDRITVVRSRTIKDRAGGRSTLTRLQSQSQQQVLPFGRAQPHARRGGDLAGLPGGPAMAGATIGGGGAAAAKEAVSQRPSGSGAAAGIGVAA